MRDSHHRHHRSHKTPPPRHHRQGGRHCHHRHHRGPFGIASNDQPWIKGPKSKRHTQEWFPTPSRNGNLGNANVGILWWIKPQSWRVSPPALRVPVAVAKKSFRSQCVRPVGGNESRGVKPWSGCCVRHHALMAFLTRQAASMFEAIVLVPALASEWASRSRGSRRWRLGAARACELCAGCCWALLKLKRSLTNYRIILCRGSGPQAGWVGRCVCVGSGGGEGGGSVIN